MSNVKKITSSSRTYVAMCHKSNFDGFYFRKFVLPERMEHTDTSNGQPYSVPVENTSASAEWYFLNRLNSVACLECCIPWEDYQDLKNEEDVRHPALG